MKKVYSGGFTAEHLYRNELKILVGLELEGLSTKQIKEKVLEENLFHCRSETAIRKMIPAVYRRFNTLDEELKQLLVKSSRSDQNAILLYAFLKVYQLPRDFVLEVLHYNLKKFSTTVTEGNITAFFEEKEQQYEQVRNWTDQTKYKLKQIIVKTLADGELLVRREKEYEIKPIPLSKNLQQHVERNVNYRDLVLLTLNE